MAKQKTAILAVVGGESLFGRELRERLDEAKLPVDLKLIATEDDQTAIFSTQGGEPVLMTALQAENLVDARVVVLAGTAKSAREALDILGKRGTRPILVDALGSLDEDPAARLHAPMLEDASVQGEMLHVVAHPAAVVLATALGRLHRSYPVRRSVVQIFEPASERGTPGIQELQQQTASLLSFKKLPKDVYDTQVSFNLVPAYGEDAPLQLERIEEKIERHLASLLARSGNVPMPSIRLSQAPVFHGYTFSLWVEFEQRPSPARIGEALASTHVDVRSADLEPPSNVGVAGQSGLTVGSIREDHNDPRAAWIWIAADNLRITADNTIEVLRALLG